MIYKSRSFSSTAARKRRPLSQCRSAIGYFGKELELLRLLAIGLLFTPFGCGCIYWLFVSVAGLWSGTSSSLCPTYSTFDNSPCQYRAEATVEALNDASVQEEKLQQTADFPGWTNLVTEQAEQNAQAVAQNVEQQLWPDFSPYNDVYQGESAFWSDDIISNFFANIGQLLGKWLSQSLSDWRVVVGLTALFAVDTGFRSFVRLPGRNKRENLKFRATKVRCLISRFSNRRAWIGWKISSK
jgi:hypothetical protein